MKYLILLFALLISSNAWADDYLVHYERIVLSDAPCDNERNYFKAAKNDAHGYVERGCWAQVNGFILLKFNETTEQYPIDSFEQVEEKDL